MNKHSTTEHMNKITIISNNQSFSRCLLQGRKWLHRHGNYKQTKQKLIPISHGLIYGLLWEQTIQWFFIKDFYHSHTHCKWLVTQTDLAVWTRFLMVLARVSPCCFIDSTCTLSVLSCKDRRVNLHLLKLFVFFSL